MITNRLYHNENGYKALKRKENTNMEEKLLNPMWAYRKKWYQTETGKEYRKRSRQKYYSRFTYAKRHRQRWTDAEEIMVLSHRISDRELAEKLGRSLGAIQRKRTIIKKRLGYTE